MDGFPLEKTSPALLEQPGPESDKESDTFIKESISFTGNIQIANPVLQRPGITNNTLCMAAIKRVSAEEASSLCDLSAEGIWIPYCSRIGNTILINGNPYGRLRIGEPVDEKKYHQALGTGSHAYLPFPFAEDYKAGKPLFLTEGEFKCLSLAESGYQAAALPGFYGYTNGEIIPELKELIDAVPPSKIYFIGDNDTCLNHLFPVAVMRFAEMVYPIPVYLPRIHLDMPKGIDDVKADMLIKNVNFEDYMSRITAEAKLVDVKNTSPADLALTLLESELDRIKSGHFGDLSKEKVRKRMLRIAAFFSNEDPIVTDRIIEIIADVFHLRQRVVGKAVNCEAAKMKAKLKSERLPQKEDNESRIYFDGKNYWRMEADGNYHQLGRQDVELDLKKRDFSPWSAEGGITSPLENELYRIQKENRVDYAGPLCGRPVGLYSENGSNILVTKGPDFIGGEGGDPLPLINFFSNLFGKGANDPLWQTQFMTFCHWLKRFRCAMRHPGEHLPGQMLALVGPKDVGKTLGQELISKCMGDRSADPSLWLQGKSTFNGEMWCSEHLILSDANLEDDPRHKQLFRDKLKEIVANSIYPLHRKNKDVINARPIWRITLSANDDPDSGFILPSLDENNADKIIYLKVYPPPVPFPTSSENEYPLFYKSLVDSVPAFVKSIDETECPEELRKGRFGVREFHHPDILELINSHNPNSEFAEHLESWIDSWMPANKTECSLVAGDLYEALCNHRWGVFRGICKSPRHLGHLMRKISTCPGWKGRILKESVRKGVNRSELTAWKILKNQPQN